MKDDQNTSKKRKKNQKDKSTVTPTGKGWNPTKPEARGGFIFHVQTSNDVHTSLKQLQNTLETYKLPLQPRPIVVGPIDNIVSYHIFINEVQYDFETSARAIEVAFKTYYSLNAHYPLGAKAPWLFIERAVFKLNAKHEHPVPVSVTSFIGDLNINFN
ncbi:uncharacterized protein LOC130675203 [Microplitis mediator]|uniref:uncharacterized protein LOC130675203 n=1 Tax=Microplitis mediator TaxID=375433 RepID=UPI002555351F|nr:uncharacterized protein LOC130675203 [Microplitis mediator]